MAKRSNSTYYELVKAKYESGEWNKKMLRLLVASGRITATEYKAITGEAY